MENDSGTPDKNSEEQNAPPRSEQSQGIPTNLTLAEKIAHAISADVDSAVDDHPTSPSSVPGGRGRGRRARLGTVVNKTPFGYEH